MKLSRITLAAHELAVCDIAGGGRSNACWYGGGFVPDNTTNIDFRPLGYRDTVAQIGGSQTSSTVLS